MIINLLFSAVGFVLSGGFLCAFIGVQFLHTPPAIFACPPGKICYPPRQNLLPPLAKFATNNYIDNNSDNDNDKRKKERKKNINISMNIARAGARVTTPGFFSGSLKGKGKRCRRAGQGARAAPENKKAEGIKSASAVLHRPG